MTFFLGIDDTDNAASRGTGYRARCLGEALGARGWTVHGITRHQLLVDPRIPYTSHNSSACLVVQAPPECRDELAAMGRRFLLQESAEGSDAGLCVAGRPAVGPEVQSLGRAAKEEVLTQAAALELAQRAGILLEGLTGTGGGVIGALAAVGLRAGGDDGRFIWLRGVRELRGVLTAAELFNQTAIDEICTLEGAAVPLAERIDVGPWPRPILRAGRAVLLVEPNPERAASEWRILPREVIRRY